MIKGREKIRQIILSGYENKESSDHTLRKVYKVIDSNAEWGEDETDEEEDYQEYDENEEESEENEGSEGGLLDFFIDLLPDDER